MMYVRRNQAGAIVAAFANPQPQPDGTDLAPEAIAADAAELLAFLDPPPGVPRQVPRWQARRALLNAGLLDAVEAAVAAADRHVQITWEDAPNIVRDSPFIAAIGPSLGLTDAQIDALFVAAAQIT
jgi:hypothetical protein